MAEKVVTLKVNGLHCQGCATTVGNALQRVKGVKHGEVELENKRAIITFDSDQTNVEQLKKAVRSAGFRAE